MIQNSLGGENVTDYVVGEQCYPSYRPASPRLKEQTLINRPRKDLPAEAVDHAAGAIG